MIFGVLPKTCQVLCSYFLGICFKKIKYDLAQYYEYIRTYYILQI
jgi:hypothetical protein